MKKTSEPLLGGELRSQQAAGRLIGELRSGRYAGAGQLPSEVELAAALGVTVEKVPMPQGGGIVTFACYYEPDRIELCADNAQEVQGLLQAAGLEERLGSVDVLDFGAALSLLTKALFTL